MRNKIISLFTLFVITITLFDGNIYAAVLPPEDAAPCDTYAHVFEEFGVEVPDNASIGIIHMIDNVGSTVEALQMVSIEGETVNQDILLIFDEQENAAGMLSLVEWSAVSPNGMIQIPWATNSMVSVHATTSYLLKEGAYLQPQSCGFVYRKKDTSVTVRNLFVEVVYYGDLFSYPNLQTVSTEYRYRISKTVVSPVQAQNYTQSSPISSNRCIGYTDADHCVFANFSCFINGTQYSFTSAGHSWT